MIFLDYWHLYENAVIIADGYHARVDGLKSLAVFLGAIGVFFGYPLADPFSGLLITVTIMKIVWDSGVTIFSRLIDGVDPGVIDEIRHAVNHVSRVKEVTEVRARWSGHQLIAELNIAVDSQLSVSEGHEVAVEIRNQLLNHLKYIANAVIHVDPDDASGEHYHMDEK